MKSILKHLIKNRIALLCVLDVAIVIWIAWYERGIEYERLLDIQYEVLLDMGLPLIPLCETIYDTMIVTITINMVVLLLEIRRRYVYFSLIMFCMLWGSFYISTRIYGSVISESNTLFRLPIWLFGKELFTSIFTAPSLYLSVCFIHLCICLFYLHLCVVQNCNNDK